MSSAQERYDRAAERVVERLRDATYTGHVGDEGLYFVYCEPLDLVKIGYSRAPRDRAGGIARQCPSPTTVTRVAHGFSEEDENFLWHRCTVRRSPNAFVPKTGEEIARANRLPSPTEWFVPDAELWELARIPGRLTCKHCGASIEVIGYDAADGTDIVTCRCTVAPDLVGATLYDQDADE